MKNLLTESIQEEAQNILVTAVNCWTVSVDKLEDARSSLICGSFEMGLSRGSFGRGKKHKIKQ